MWQPLGTTQRVYDWACCACNGRGPTQPTYRGEPLLPSSHWGSSCAAAFHQVLATDRLAKETFPGPWLARLSGEAERRWGELDSARRRSGRGSFRMWGCSFFWKGRSYMLFVNKELFCTILVIYMSYGSHEPSATTAQNSFEEIAANKA